MTASTPVFILNYKPVHAVFTSVGPLTKMFAEIHLRQTPRVRLGTGCVVRKCTMYADRSCACPKVTCPELYIVPPGGKHKKNQHIFNVRLKLLLLSIGTIKHRASERYTGVHMTYTIFISFNLLIILPSPRCFAAWLCSITPSLRSIASSLCSIAPSLRSTLSSPHA